MSPAECKRRAALALGVCLIALTFLLETWVADRRMPNPASPFVWTALGAVAVLALAFAWWYRRKARETST
jgi:drug/metabolite transporter (DMT)-like permease